MKNQSRSVGECLRSLFANELYDALTDAELLRRFIKTRDEGAFSCWVRRHGPMVMSLARRIVRDHQLAEDVFQATFLVLARTPRAVRGRDRLPAWLHRVAFRLAVRAKKTRQRMQQNDVSQADHGAADLLDELSAREYLAFLDELLGSEPCFSADGKTLLSSNPPLDLVTGNAAKMENLPPMKRESDHQFVALPDGQGLLVSSEEGVKSRNLKSGQFEQTLSGAGDQMILAPDGKTVFTNNGALQRWDLATGKPLYRINLDQGHWDEVGQLAFTADGKRLASGGADGSVRLWSAETGQPIQVWLGARTLLRKCRGLVANSKNKLPRPKRVGVAC